MPLRKGSSDKTKSYNISKLMNEYEKTGKIGNSTPKNKKAAHKQAIAIALSKSREKKNKKKKFKSFTESFATNEQNRVLVDTLIKGFYTCFESEFDNNQPQLDLTQARNLAAEWHSGELSPLYLFAATGKIQDEEHRKNLLKEIDNNLIHSSEEEGEEDELFDLSNFIESLPVGTSSMTEAANTKYTYNGQPVEVLKNKGFDDEHSTEIWTIKTSDGNTLDVKSRDLKMGS